MPDTSPYPRGSEWRKWDLHVHSPLTILNNQFRRCEDGAPDWDAFLGRLEGADLAVVGITDYFTIDGYKEARRQQRQLGRLQGITILPNIEFRLNKMVPRGSDGAEKRLTLHVLFAEDVEPSDIEEHFLHDIDFVYEGNPQQPGNTRKLKVTNLEAVGQRLKAENPSFQGSSLQVGAMTAVVDDQEICKRLSREPRFAGKYLVALADEHLSDIRWTGQGHLVRQVLLQRADLVFSSNENSIQWCLGQPPYQEGEEAFVREFKTLKPCVHGSDAHDLDRIGVPCSRRGEQGHICGPGAQCELRHCWIKSDPTFEGLRQVVYEPQARVRVAEDSPASIPSTRSLGAIRIPETAVNSDLTVAVVELPLNQSLIAVTGGKGSGKTALLDIIAHAFTDRRNVQNKNSFVKRVVSDAPRMHVALEFADGTTFGKRLSEAAVCTDGQITYIAQGELEERISDKEKLGSHIRDLVLGSPQVKDGVRTFELHEAEKQGDGARRELKALHAKIQASEDKSTKAVEDKIGRQEQELRTATTDMDARIAALAKKLGEARAEKARETQGRLNALEETRDTLLEVRDAVDEVIQFATEDLPPVVTKVEKINISMSSLALDQLIPFPSAYSSEALGVARAAIENRLRETLLAIEASAAVLSTFEDGIREHAALLRSKAEFDGRMAGLAAETSELAQVRQQLQQLYARRLALFRTLLSGVLTQRDIYTDLFDTFGANKQRVLADIVFTPEVSYDDAALEDAVVALVDGRQVRDIPYELQKLHSAFRVLAGGDEAGIDEAVTAIMEIAKSLAGRLKATRALNRATLYQVLWDTYLVLQPTIRYKGTPLDRLSLGQKATVLVKVYLAEGTSPILIDSHDEHMDNEFIMHELVGALREAKEYRQVIIASNNGNVVVNSDAEQVVLAKFSDGKISYTSGSLEDPNVREAALQVLEGGEDAFRKRRAKYRVTP